ncbi:ZYRO0G21846p [Zygosaccharomyces rouxii]|uniref:ZYRO0G21846p n=1 Tax=Zygosaccharomyces rouxii (strain ATCC 2623 / CBS 732 / NBRC 1130 / NCYC 568 / NRRL Y-229) TaxID=559307 RepID=C5E1L1_ZYGRC|nr:uncharacterized protein ZYRO0G21846g [Zygosaccharomyces rouxii]KAH9202985.1 hypothetical protein LQ764DRAFT_73468 [Zygosaccharomyces rouxii]CAR29995.1 ZYRO0G21846p [Zygosaccharomyces rouxii]
MDVETRYRKDMDYANDPLLSYLLNTKHLGNLSVLTADAVKSDLKGYGRRNNILQYQEQYGKLEFECFENQQDRLSLMSKEYRTCEESQRTRRFSVDFDVPGVESTASINGAVEEELGREESADQEGLTELRRRLLGRRHSVGSDVGRSTDRQIEDQDNLQNELVQDMTKLVGSLRQGATAFQNALDEDKFVLDAAEIGVQVASRSLTDISGKLKKYDKKKLGYLFYILATLFMIIGLLVTFVIIKLFPAL